MKYYPIHMHLHCAHEATASIGSHMSHAKALEIEYLWLTEHDSRIGKPKGKYFGFSFPEPKLWVHLPDIGRDAGFQETEENTGSYAFEKADNKIALQICAEKGQRESLHFHSQAKKHSDPLLAGVTVELDADIELDGGRAIVEFILSAQPPTYLQARLRYVLGATPSEAELVQNLPFPEKKDGKYRFTLSADVSEKIGGLDNGLCNLKLIAENGAVIRLRTLDFYRELEYEKARQAQIVLAEQLGKQWGVTPFVGFEVSCAGNHKNCFSTKVPVIEYAAYDYKVSNEQSVEHLQKHHAVYSWNHPFSEHGCKGQTKEEIFEEKAQQLIHARVYGAHLMEVGFPYTRGGFEVEYYLRLWDRLSASGILITGEGDSDNHHATPEGWTTGNNFCSFAGLYEDEQPTEENFQKAFQRGTLWGGNPVVIRQLSFTGDGKEQGSLIRGEQAEISFSANGIQCDGYAVCISNGKEVARLPFRHGNVAGNWVLANEQTYNFARVELYNEKNVLIAFSNPIYLVAEKTEIEER